MTTKQRRARRRRRLWCMLWRILNATNYRPSPREYKVGTLSYLVYIPEKETIN